MDDGRNEGGIRSLVLEIIKDRENRYMVMFIDSQGYFRAFIALVAIEAMIYCPLL